MKKLMIFAFFVLAGCGVDGAPTKPEPAPSSGITISGEASIGVVGRL